MQLRKQLDGLRFFAFLFGLFAPLRQFPDCGRRKRRKPISGFERISHRKNNRGFRDRLTKARSGDFLRQTHNQNFSFVLCHSIALATYRDAALSALALYLSLERKTLHARQRLQKYGHALLEFVFGGKYYLTFPPLFLLTESSSVLT